MSAVTQIYLLPAAGNDFGPRSDGLVTLHTFESAPDRITMRDALVGARWQETRPGSYNRIIAVDGVLQTVVDHHASGGINPGSHAWNPEPWLYDPKFGLLPEMIRNPNYFTLNLSAMGVRTWFDANGWPAGIIDGFAKSIIDEERRIGRPVIVTNHLDFQDNRTDAGAIATRLVMKRYAELKAVLPDTAVEVPDVYEWIPAMKHQIPKPVIVRAGAKPLSNPDGTLHAGNWSFPTATKLECVGGLYDGAQFWVVRRYGGGGLFLIRTGDVVEWPKVEPVVVEKIVEKVVTVEDTARLDALKAKVAALAADIVDD